MLAGIGGVSAVVPGGDLRASTVGGAGFVSLNVCAGEVGAAKLLAVDVVAEAVVAGGVSKSVMTSTGALPGGAGRELTSKAAGLGR